MTKWAATTAIVATHPNHITNKMIISRVGMVFLAFVECHQINGVAAEPGSDSVAIDDPSDKAPLSRGRGISRTASPSVDFNSVTRFYQHDIRGPWSRQEASAALAVDI